MTPPTARYRAYMLRLWHTPEPASGWRATLEDPHTGQRLAFATLADLEAFLAQPPADETGRALSEKPRSTAR